MSEVHPLPAADYWRLVAATQRVTIVQLEAKWALAKAEEERVRVDAEIRAAHAIPAGADVRLAEAADDAH